MLRLFLFAAFLAFSNISSAAEFMDGFYRVLTNTFSSNNCNSAAPALSPASTSSPTVICDQQPMASANRQDLSQVTENSFYPRLVQLETARLQCMKADWESFNSANSGGLNQTFMINKMNAVIADLQFIKREVGRLSAQMQLIRGRIPNNVRTGETRNSTYQPLLDEYNQKNEVAQKLLVAYQQRLSEIPNADNPLVQDFIEGQLSTFSDNATAVTPESFERLRARVAASFQNSITELNREVRSREGLSIREKARLANDPDLIAQLSSENPNSTATIARLQCLASRERSTQSVVQTGFTVASFVLPGGAFMMARLARSAFVFNSARLSQNLMRSAKAFGWSSVALGSVEAANSLHEQCLRSTQAEVSGQCGQTPQTLIQQHQLSSCLWEATLNAVPALSRVAGGGVLLNRFSRESRENQALRRFIEENSGRDNLRNRNLAAAANLNPRERRIAAEGILGRQLTPAQADALNRAHNVGAERGIGGYTEQDIEQKREILRQAGFSQRETETLLWKGIAGGEGPEMLAMIQRRLDEFFGRRITPAERDAIIAVDSDRSLSAAQKMERLTSAGFSREQAEEILRGRHHAAGSRSQAPVATTASARPASPPSTSAPQTAAASPPPARPVAEPPRAPASAPNPFLNDPNYRGSVNSEALSRLGAGRSGVTDTEARMALDGYATSSGITSANRNERMFRSVNLMSENIVRDIQNAERALREGRSLTPADRARLNETIQNLKARCRSIADLAARAGLNGESLQNTLNQNASKHCN
jgi:hypothetical protein